MRSYELKFISTLDENTINENTCAVKDELGKNLKCMIKYNKENASIQIVPQELCKDNKNYYLIISDSVKTLDGGTMGKQCQIRFKVVNKNLIEMITLRGKTCKSFENTENIDEPAKNMPVITEYDMPYFPELKQKSSKSRWYAMFIASVSILSIIVIVNFVL